MMIVKKLFAAAAILLSIAACSSDKKTDTSTTTTTTQPGKPSPSADWRTFTNPQSGYADRVFFDYNEYALTAEGQRTAQAWSEWLKAHPQARMLIEGHADERGTREYNLALGARRASSVRNYLITLGVPANRIQTVSYGKERPEDPASNEASWAKNRRGVAVPSGPGA